MGVPTPVFSVSSLSNLSRARPRGFLAPLQVGTCPTCHTLATPLVTAWKTTVRIYRRKVIIFRLSLVKMMTCFCCGLDVTAPGGSSATGGVKRATYPPSSSSYQAPILAPSTTQSGEIAYDEKSQLHTLFFSRISHLCLTNQSDK